MELPHFDDDDDEEVAQGLTGRQKTMLGFIWWVETNGFIEEENY